MHGQAQDTAAWGGGSVRGVGGSVADDRVLGNSDGQDGTGSGIIILKNISSLYTGDRLQGRFRCPLI